MIPKIIHFVYGLEENFGGKEFGFAHWAAIRSAMKFNPDYKIYYWYKHLPDNYYFKDLAPHLELIATEPPDEIYGNALMHVAHKADIVRLNALINHGGIYLDIDTITVKNFDDLLSNKCVMGYESVEGNRHGICNAVIFAEKNSDFLNKWLYEYKYFRSKGRDEYWAEHAVLVPLSIAQNNPDLITLLDEKAFFYPGWTDDGLKSMFYEENIYPEAYVHHLWESLSWGALKSFNEFNFETIKCTYTKIISTLLSDESVLLRKSRSKWVNDQIKFNCAKLNIGCGPNKSISEINCDQFEQTGADLIFDASKKDWPMPDNSVESVKLFHVLEHISGDVQYFFQELYRVCKEGALIYIHVPHPRHDWFLIDPTHVKSWHQESFSYLDKSISLKRYFSEDSKTPLALYWDIDFETVELVLFTESTNTNQEVMESLGVERVSDSSYKYLNNCIAEIRVILKCRKTPR